MWAKDRVQIKDRSWRKASQEINNSLKNLLWKSCSVRGKMHSPALTSKEKSSVLWNSMWKGNANICFSLFSQWIWYCLKKLIHFKNSVMLAVLHSSVRKTLFCWVFLCWKCIIPVQLETSTKLNWLKWDSCSFWGELNWFYEVHSLPHSLQDYLLQL